MKEALMPDGTTMQVDKYGTVSFDGTGLMGLRWQIISCIHGLSWNLKTGGHTFAPRRGQPTYTQQALNLIESIMLQQEFPDGEPFVPYVRRGPKARAEKERAMEDAKWIMSELNKMAVVLETEE